MKPSTKVWLITSGDYSDYSVHFVVATEEMAKAICEDGHQGTSSRYEYGEYELFDELPPLARSWRLGCATMLDGTVIEAEPIPIAWYVDLPYYAAPNPSVNINPLIDIVKPVVVTPDGTVYVASNDYANDPRGRIAWQIVQRSRNVPGLYGFDQGSWRWTVVGVELEVTGPDAERVRKVYSDKRAEILAMIDVLAQPSMWADEDGRAKYWRGDTVVGKLATWPE